MNGALGVAGRVTTGRYIETAQRRRAARVHEAALVARLEHHEWFDRAWRGEVVRLVRFGSSAVVDEKARVH